MQNWLAGLSRALDVKIESYVWTALLVTAWVVLDGFLQFWTEATLVPWDTTSIRPPVGSWPRMLNDYFESGTGSFIIGRIVVGSSLLLFLWRMTQPGPGRAAAPYLFTASTIAAILLLVPGTLLGATIGYALTPERSVPDFGLAQLLNVLGAVLLLGWMLLTQACVLPFPIVSGGELRLIRFTDPPVPRLISRMDRLILLTATLTAVGVVGLRMAVIAAEQQAIATILASGATGAYGEQINALMPWPLLNAAATVWLIVFAVSVTLNLLLVLRPKLRTPVVAVGTALHCFGALAGSSIVPSLMSAAAT